MLIEAALLYNPDGSHIDKPYLWIKDNTIVYAGDYEGLSPSALSEAHRIRLKDFVIFPGLVNAHCHLELTLPAPPYRNSFTGWISDVLQTKNSLSESDISQNIKRGIGENIASGVTCVADHASFNTDLDRLTHMPLRAKVFLESIGVSPDVADTTFNANAHHAEIFKAINSRIELINSPHSVHALNPQTLSQFNKNELHSIHLLESLSEAQYFREQSGSMWDFIVGRDPGHAKPLSASPLELLKQQGLLNEKLLAIHMNYATLDELKLIAASGSSIVHCPLSHEYFNHAEFPLEQVLNYQINLALGTDSLSSSRSLSMLEILRVMREKYPVLSQQKIFQLATSGGAKALGLQNEIGLLAAGRKADIIGVPLLNGEAPLDSLFMAREVNFSMIDGLPIIPPLKI